jgi:putative metalloenzyme radical SAM/SPASM domain maturase
MAQAAPTKIRTPVQARRHPALAPLPAKLVLEPTTQCNLQCAMCVKQGAGNHMPQGDMSWQTFERLSPAFPNLQALIFSGLGEPLMHPDLEGFAARAVEDMPPGAWIGLQTNGQLLSQERAMSLARAGVNKVCVSVDSSDPETLAKMRVGAQVQSLDLALAALGRAKREVKRDLRIGVEVVLMADNLQSLPRLISWAASGGVDFVLATQMLPYDQAMAPQVLYGGSTDLALEFYERWKHKALEEGIELSQYRKVVFKHKRNATERKFIAFFNRLREEALALEVPINLPKLLGQDQASAKRAAQIFEQAQEVAREQGLELTLPALFPRAQRYCRFVEEATTFVSWRGQVHPCYFLWHQYSCVLDGRYKFVRPKVFGDLGHDGLQDLWQGEVYSRFRRDVLNYDYPYCINCKVGPCDYLENEEFSSDCYTVEVPCGDCPWPLGLLNCLQ